MFRFPVQLLNALVVFGDAANMHEAALRLGITQPALSKQLASLEKSVGRPLFSIVGRKKTLTPFGRDLHRRLKKRMNGLDELVRQTASRHDDESRARIRIAGRRGILDRVSERTRFSGLIEFREASTERVLRELADMRAEIGIAYARSDSHEIMAKPLFRERFRLAVPKKLLARQTAFGSRLFPELRSLPCIGYRNDDELLGRFAESNGIAPRELRMIRATSDYRAIAGMVEAGIGWALLPSYLEPDSERVWTIEIPGPSFAGREFYLLYRKEFAKVTWFKNLLTEIGGSFS